MYKEMFVEYTLPEFGTQVQTEVMSWEAFCNLSMEWALKSSSAVQQMTPE